MSSPALARIAAHPRIKIFYVIDSLNIGGAETQLLALIRSGLAEGHEIAVGYFTPGVLSEELDRLGVPSYRLSRHGLRDPSVVPRLRWLLRRLRPDVLHTHLRKSDLAGQLAAAWAGVPARLSTIHNLAPWRRRRSLSFIARWMTAGCQRFIACGDAVRDYASRVGGIAPGRIEVVENGVDVEHYDPARFSAGDPLKKTIGIVARLHPTKGHRTFIKAAGLLARRRRDLRFVVVGDGPMREEIVGEVVRAGLEERFEFTGTLRDVAPRMRSFDIVTLASISEGLPVTLLEAMALERPVVATRVGGIPDVITDGTNGLLIDPCRPLQMAGAWDRLFEDPTMARRIAARARRTVIERFDQRRLHRRVRRLYATLAGVSGEDA